MFHSLYTDEETNLYFRLYINYRDFTSKDLNHIVSMFLFRTTVFQILPSIKYANNRVVTGYRDPLYPPTAVWGPAVSTDRGHYFICIFVQDTCGTSDPYIKFMLGSKENTDYILHAIIYNFDEFLIIS